MGLLTGKPLRSVLGGLVWLISLAICANVPVLFSFYVIGVMIACFWILLLEWDKKWGVRYYVYVWSPKMWFRAWSAWMRVFTWPWSLTCFILDPDRINPFGAVKGRDNEVLKARRAS